VPTPSATSASSADLNASTGGRGGGERPGRTHHEEEGHAGPSPVAGPVSQKPIRRRMRMITSCLECRRRKLKCEKKHPCFNCNRFQRECVYLGPNLDEASQQRLTEIKEKVGSLERQLERDVAKGATGRRPGSPKRNGDGPDSSHQRFVADDVEEELGEERGLQITPMVALDLTYDDYSDGNGTDDLIDLGVRVGKMRITERIGGLNRPRISEEVCDPLYAFCSETVSLTQLRYKPALPIPKVLCIVFTVRSPPRSCKMLPTFRISSNREIHTLPQQADSSLASPASRSLSSTFCRPQSSATD